MNTPMRTLTLAAALLLAACTGTSTPPGARTSPLRVPLTAELAITSSTPGHATLAARVRRHVGFAADVAVHVSVPAGARLTGPTDWISPGTATASTDERSLEVAFDAVPATDLELEASVQGTGFGVTAHAAYDFARPAPAAAAVARPPDGPHLIVGGHDLGPSRSLRPGD